MAKRGKQQAFARLDESFVQRILFSKSRELLYRRRFLLQIALRIVRQCARRLTWPFSEHPARRLTVGGSGRIRSAGDGRLRSFLASLNDTFSPTRRPSGKAGVRKEALATHRRIVEARRCAAGRAVQFRICRYRRRCSTGRALHFRTQTATTRAGRNRES